MEIRERAIEEIKKLDSKKLMTLYEIILSIKGDDNNGNKKPSLAYLNVREALKNIKGSLAEDVSWGREDRI